MTTHLPITPPLERLLREQLATGRFQDAEDVVATALRLLGENSLPPARTGGPADSAFGLWKGRSPDGLAYERELRAD